MFGDFWQNFGLNFPFFGTDRAGGMFGGTFSPDQAMQDRMGQAGMPPGGPELGAGKPGGPGAPGSDGMARAAPAGAAVAQPPPPPTALGSPLAPGGTAGGALAPGQQRQPARGLEAGSVPRDYTELLRQYDMDLGGRRA